MSFHRDLLIRCFINSQMNAVPNCFSQNHTVNFDTLVQILPDSLYESDKGV